MSDPHKVITLQRALRAALRWPYQQDMLEHIKSGVPKDQGYNDDYIADIFCIRAGVKLLDD